MQMVPAGKHARLEPARRIQVFVSRQVEESPREHGRRTFVRFWRNKLDNGAPSKTRGWNETREFSANQTTARQQAAGVEVGFHMQIAGPRQHTFREPFPCPEQPASRFQ